MSGTVRSGLRGPGGRSEPVAASQGWGPLVQRDYWAVLREPKGRPSQLIAVVKERFPDFPPQDLVRFRRADGRAAPLRVGDDLEVRIRMAGTCGVRVVHESATSLTLATLPGHPEAGRITFGAYHDDEGRVIFHIRSRARSSSRTRRFGFLVGGDPMQTGTWTDFIDRLAAMLAQGIDGAIHAESRFVPEEPEDRTPPGAPTFVAEAE